MPVLLFAIAAHAATLDFVATSPSRAPVRVGVISGPTPINGSPDLSARFSEFGIKYVRNNDYYDDRLDIEGILNCGGSTYPSWDGCDAGDERNYQWGPSDSLMKAMQSAHVEPMLRIGGEWENHAKKHDFKGPQNATQEANWISAAAKIAARYRGQYAYLDIWTEFPGEKFWDRKQDDFYPFWASAFRALKKAVPEARVGGPGFSGLATKAVMNADDRQVARHFLNEMYKEKVRPDWVGWHLFTNEPGDYAKAGAAYRRLLDGTGEFSGVPWARDHAFAGVELVLDAMGTTDRLEGHEHVDPTVVSELHSGARGAAVLAASLIAVQATDTTRAYIYRAGDLVPRKGGTGGNWVGLFGGDPGGTPKKTAHAVRLWNTFTAGYPSPVAISVPPGGGVWAVVAANAAGRAMYVANDTDAATKVTFGAGLHVGKDGAAKAWFLDAKRDGTTEESASLGSLSLPAWGVALVAWSGS